MAKPICCHFHNEYDPKGGPCEQYPSKKSLQAFQEKLDIADKEQMSEYDEQLNCHGDYDTNTVDKTFFVCQNHRYLVTCYECKKLLSRHQMYNCIHSQDYNHLNHGLCVGPPGCTKCWIEFDSEIRCELGIESYSNIDSDSDSTSKDDTPDTASMATVSSLIAAVTAAAPTQTLNPYQEFYVQIHPTIKAENPTWTPQQITTEIGRRWSLQTMTLTEKNGEVCLKYSTTKHILDGCGSSKELKTYLESYRRKHGDQALLTLVEKLK
jgi:hypothetical protein